MVSGVEDRPRDTVDARLLECSEDLFEELPAVCSNEAADLLEDEECRPAREDGRDGLPDQQALTVGSVDSEPEAGRGEGRARGPSEEAVEVREAP